MAGAELKQFPQSLIFSGNIGGLTIVLLQLIQLRLELGVLIFATDAATLRSGFDSDVMMIVTKPESPLVLTDINVIAAITIAINKKENTLTLNIRLNRFTPFA